MTTDFHVAILAGGLATRLGSRTSQLPKSLIPIAGRPFIEYQLKNLAMQGAFNVVLCVGHLGSQIRDFVLDGSRFGLNVTYSLDGATKLGTGGALVKASSLLSDQFYVTYGDSFLRSALEPLAEKSKSSNLKNVMAIYRNQNAFDVSNVSVLDAEHISYSRKKPVDSTHIDYGISLISKKNIQDFTPMNQWELPEFFEATSASQKLGFAEAAQRFYEIGSIAGIEDFEKYVEGGGCDDLL